MRGIDPARFPNVVSALRDAGLDPTRELVPVAPAAHYMMGGIVTDLDGRSTVAGALRGRRVLVHRAARRQPAGVELAERVLRVRPPRGRARARAAPAEQPVEPGAGRDRGRSPSASRRPRRARRVRRCGATPASCGRAEGLRGCSAIPHPLARLIARCALAREESRGAHLRADLPERDPALDHRHAVLGAADRRSGGPGADLPPSDHIRRRGGADPPRQRRPHPRRPAEPEGCGGPAAPQLGRNAARQRPFVFIERRGGLYLDPFRSPWCWRGMEGVPSDRSLEETAGVLQRDI